MWDDAARRALDIVLASVLLVGSTPLLAAIALWIWRDGSGSVLYGEERLGEGGVPFRIHKFRTLRAGSPVDPSVAPDGDRRVTRPGRFLRRWRLDELPQLYDVLRGTMSLVGPRPSTAPNLEAIDDASRARLLAMRPGLTGPSALAHLGEDEVLASVPDPVAAYRHVLMPEKVRLDLATLAHRSLTADLGLLLRTAQSLFSPSARRHSAAHVRTLLACGDARSRNEPADPDLAPPLEAPCCASRGQNRRARS